MHVRKKYGLQNGELIISKIRFVERVHNTLVTVKRVEMDFGLLKGDVR